MGAKCAWEGVLTRVILQTGFRKRVHLFSTTVDEHTGIKDFDTNKYSYIWRDNGHALKNNQNKNEK